MQYTLRASAINSTFFKICINNTFETADTNNEFSGIIKHTGCENKKYAYKRSSKIPSLLYSNLFTITWQNWDPHTRKIYETIKLYKRQWVIWNPSVIVRGNLDQGKSTYFSANQHFKSSIQSAICLNKENRQG